jgi:hypothetical protein
MHNYKMEKCMTKYTPLSQEQLRAAANLAQFHDAWLSAARRLAELPYGMAWKTSSGREYLYELKDRAGNGVSLGPRSPDTERMHASYRQDKSDTSEREKNARGRMLESSRILRALRAPGIYPESAAILREASIRAMLGVDIFVVGTVAMTAYQYEAAHLLGTGLDATADFDLAWAGRGLEVAYAHPRARSVLALLKSVDSTYTVNTERKFQALNKNAYEVEFLVAPSVSKTIPRSERLQPIPMPEQEWLLEGNFVEQVVPATDGTAALLVAPDPRWFALHKLWLADKPTRNPLKKPKDRAQGELLLDAIREGIMPRFPLDDAFRNSVPAELKKYLTAATAS